MVSQNLIPLIIAGPTGSGKSSLAIKLALKHKGEIICADSRQCYKHMDIGSAAPSIQEKNLIPHHGYGIIDPAKEKMDAGLFVKLTTDFIADIQKRGKRPIIVGGTGLYLRALRYGIINLPTNQKKLREDLEKECLNIGLDKMYERLKSIDEHSASFIKSNDKMRILRALEIFLLTNKKPSELRTNFLQEPNIKAHWLLVKINKEKLLNNLFLRSKIMFEQGLLEEALHLKKILAANHWALETMGFKQALQYLNNEISLNDAIELTFIAHRQYAKRQLTWFKKESFYKEIPI